MLIGKNLCGEGSNSLTNRVKVGAFIQAGQKVGQIGCLGHGLHPMLHLEHYSGRASGLITQFKSPPYFRRADLLDGTKLLDSLLCLRNASCSS